jgi:2-dehydro-3-deoxygalactonokinase
MTAAAWIAVDWGTTRLRAWAMDGAGAVLAEACSAKGMGALTPEGFEAALLDIVAGWLGPGTTLVIACGMVGARQGWTEAAYRPVPCPPLGPPLTRAPTADPRIEVRIIPGLSQLSPGADVIRGEETQIAGYLRSRPAFDGVLCLPGTHSKWVLVSAGEVVAFQTVMTGELFALLATQSVLRHTVAADAADPEAFDAGVDRAISKPEALPARLFALRAEALLQDLTPSVAGARLSGLMIGAELGATKGWWLGREVALIGAPSLAALYARALAAQGLIAATLDATALTLDGLRAAHALWSPA